MKKKNSGVITIEDLAKEAGVSAGTVDRVLHNRGRYSQASEEKVRGAIKKLGYKPNLMARNLAKQKTCRLACLIPRVHQRQEYWTFPANGMQKCIQEFNLHHITLDFFEYGRRDRTEFRQKAQSCLEGEYDGYILAPLISDLSLEFLKKISPHTPVVFFNSDLPDTQRLAYVGQRNYRGGKLAAWLMNLLVQGNTEQTIRIISPTVENYHLDRRILGFQENLHSPHSLIYLDDAQNQEEVIFASLDQNIPQKSTSGIFVSDSSAYIVASWLKSRQIKIPLLGYDLIKANCQGVQEGYIDVLLNQRPYQQGYDSLRLLIQYLLMEKRDFSDIIMPIDIITSDNIEEFLSLVE
ncbi:MAG: LacI family DNA-binding transcriptional regulator [Spirochaetales bacterium]|nr:LacI family DNA-binding transcriptional regulator [Spirochaetales bacterium]